MNERLQEMSRYVEQSDQFPIRLRGGIGNSTLAGILTEFQTDHTLGDGKSIGAISRLIGCFEPIADPSNSHSESLWDQTATAVMAYKHLDQEDQEQINGMVDTLLWSLAHTPQERNVGGHVKDISPHVRELATTIGLETDTWKHITEPKQYARQKKLRMHPKTAIARALAAVSLIAACTPARPTITPETTRPAITQPAQTTEVYTSPSAATQVPSGIRLCGGGEPACPSDQSCFITETHISNSDLIVKSGVCEDSNLTPEATLPVGTPSGIATEESGTGLGRTYFEIRFDPSQPCGQSGMPKCQNMMNKPGWVENWHPDNQWPAGVIPIVDGYTYNEADGLYYPNP